jgi:mRNA-degrading endonuclease toxin of MazEF toxin-antitoxin module
MSVPWSALQPGTVVDADLGLPPATVGREIQKHRPCLVLAPMPSLGLLMIVPISKGRPKTMSYTNVELEPDRGNGLTARCFGQCHQFKPPQGLLRHEGTLRFRLRTTGSSSRDPIVV